MKVAALLLGFAVLTATVHSPPADARKYKSSHKAKSKRSKGYNYYPGRSESRDGSCPCNGGPVCVGPRGGRYCITSGGSKRYGV